MSKSHYVVTGASRGIGLEMTRQLLAEGHRVTAFVRDPSKLPKLPILEGELQVLPVDVANDEQVRAAARQIGATTPVDVLINNAGIMGDAGDFEKIDLADVEKVIAVNAIAPMRVTRALLPNLKLSKQAKAVHVTSLMGSIEDNSGGGYYGYRMSKAALNMFMRSFSRDYAGIITAAIHPGWVKTDMGGSAAPTEVAESAAGILKVVAALSRKDSGSFRDFEGDTLPW